MLGAKKIFFGILCVLLVCLGGSFASAQASSALDIEQVKLGVVEVQTGLKGYNSKFYFVKSGTGLVVSNQSGSVYVVTTKRTVTVTKKQKKKIYKKYKINNAMNNLSTEVRIIVEGDVASGVTIEADSKQDDFCVLSAKDVLKKKIALHLGSDEDIAAGDEIYAVGMADQKGMDAIYPAEIHAGSVEDTSALMDGNTYIQHSAVVLSEESGGALISKGGYLVGMNNAAIKNKNVQAYYALPISHIRGILDNYGIPYDSREKDEAYAKLKEAYEQLKKDLDSGSYKQETTEDLATAIKQIEDQILPNKDRITIGELSHAQEQLDLGRKELEKKMPKTRVLKYILLGFLVVAMLRAITLGLQYRKMKNEPVEPLQLRSTPASAGSATPVAPMMRAGQSGVPTGQRGVSTGQRGGPVQPVRRTEQVPNYFETVEETGNGTFQQTVTQGGMESEYRDGRTVMMRHELEGSGGQNRKAFRPNRAVLVNAVSGARQGIAAPYFTIGKNPENHMRIEKKTVSRRHAAITWADGKYYIEDLDSANGTYLNGRPVKEGRVPLANHDILTLADEEMEFLII